MPNPYRRDTIENWVSDFCVSDGLRSFTPELRDIAGELLMAFLVAACDVRGVDPADLEEPDLRTALLGTVARQAAPDSVQSSVPALCGAFLAQLEAEGRLGGGRVLGAYVAALREAYLQAAGGKTKPIVRPGSKLGRNDPCPCGSEKKYKKCCMKE